ncbi:glyoxalase/bleomycin resistance protein/dioxygenase [gamma proteobacterium HTCC5015]|nr:glyoxalase/bleomycin resistance protein/dioxygenase [gamma proteobacterium HTCC5015]
MKRLHVHIAVETLEQGIHFYSHLFGESPTVKKNDYAKWELDDPRVNFAISARGAKAGVEHLGIQVENPEELAQVQSRIAAADAPMEEQVGTACCYARSDKYWTQDPAGVAWEAFHTLDSIPTFNEQADSSEGSACCTPKPQQESRCC